MKNRKKLVITLIGVIVLGIGLFVYQTFIKKQLHFKENLTVEINGKFNTNSYISEVEHGSVKDVACQSKNLNIKKLGKYEVTYTYKNREYTTTIQVVDTQKPVFKGLDDLTVSLNTTPDLKACVEVSDKSLEDIQYKIDDNTKKIMDILAKYDAKATFFVTGRNQDYNYLIKDAYNAGHTIALHTYSHEYSTVYASVDAYFDDLNKVGQMVKKEIGFVPHYIRFPGGSSNTVSRRYCQGIMSTLTKEVVEKGYQYYDWNGDSTDASGNHVAVDKLIRNGTSCHDNNVMILCHDTQAKDTTVQALPAIIEHYKNLGCTFKGIDDATYAPHQSVNN